MIDASVAAKWVIDEKHSTQAVRVLDLEARHAPDHWLAETVNVLWPKVAAGDLTEADATERMAVLVRAPVIGAPLSGLMPRALAISVAHAVTIYDSLYVALAERLDIPLVSADVKLIRRLASNTAIAARTVWIGDLPT